MDEHSGFIGEQKYMKCPWYFRLPFLNGSVFIFFLFVVSTTLGADPQSEPRKVGAVQAQAYADRTVIVAGEVLNLLVVLTPDKENHIYWQNPGGTTGLPTEIEWQIPEGYRLGRTRYPAPKAHYDQDLKETNFIHEGQAAFLTPVLVPESIRPGAAAQFRVKAKWLVCRKGQCVPGEAELSLALPVAKQGEARAAHDKLFAQARQGLPLSVKDAKHVKLSFGGGEKEVQPGGKFSATLTVEIAAGHHMPSHQPLQDFLIPAFVFMEQTEGLILGEVAYPKGEERRDKTLGKLSEYTGKVGFKIPVQVSEEADRRVRWLRGILQYQICSEAGTCFPPQYIEFSAPLLMAGVAKPPVEDEFTVGSPPTADQATDSPAAGDAPVVGTANLSGWTRIQDWLFGLGFYGVLFAGFIGGFILNFMPCVLPVISLKVLSFVRQAHDHRWRVFRMGLVYSAGIMVFYGVLATIFFTWHKGWGELFQNPVFVVVMAALILAFALSLFGVFTLFTPKMVNKLGEKAEAQEGYLSAFCTGVLATLLGTACTAPFLSAAIGYASRVPPVQGAGIFLAAGFGMAFPIIVLTFNPAWLRWLPKPGPWMGVFESVMGFLLLATVIWLLNPLRVQLGAWGLLLSLIFLLAVALAAWIKGQIGFDASFRRKASLYIVLIVVLLLGWLLPFRYMATIPELVAEQTRHEELLARGALAKYGKRLDWSKGIPWQRYVRDLALQDVAAGYTVFVDYTASWCASCKANKIAFIEQPEVMAAMKELGVVPYEADYSLYNPEIKKDLERHGRAGVPMYLVYRPGLPDRSEVLPELLTRQTIIDALRRAGPSKPTLSAVNNKAGPTTDSVKP